MDFGDEMGSKLTDALLRGAERLAFSLLSGNYRPTDRRELHTATDRSEGASTLTHGERPKPTKLAKLAKKGVSRNTGKGTAAAGGLERRTGPRRRTYTASGESQPAGKRGAVPDGDREYDAVAAIFGSPEDARAAVEALASMGVAAAVTKRAADGTCEVVADVSPSKAHILGRELWKKAGAVRQRQFEEDLRAVSPGARSASLAGSLGRAVPLGLGGVA